MTGTPISPSPHPKPWNAWASSSLARWKGRPGAARPQEVKKALHSSMRREHRHQPRGRQEMEGGPASWGTVPGLVQPWRLQAPANAARWEREREERGKQQGWERDTLWNVSHTCETHLWKISSRKRDRHQNPHSPRYSQACLCYSVITSCRHSPSPLQIPCPQPQNVDIEPLQQKQSWALIHTFVLSTTSCFPGPTGRIWKASEVNLTTFCERVKDRKPRSNQASLWHMQNQDCMCAKIHGDQDFWNLRWRSSPTLWAKQGLPLAQPILQ